MSARESLRAFVTSEESIVTTVILCTAITVVALALLALAVLLTLAGLVLLFTRPLVFALVAVMLYVVVRFWQWALRD